jgi:hypothetical protein
MPKHRRAERRRDLRGRVRGAVVDHDHLDVADDVADGFEHPGQVRLFVEGGDDHERRVRLHLSQVTTSSSSLLSSLCLGLAHTADSS